MKKTKPKPKVIANLKASMKESIKIKPTLRQIKNKMAKPSFKK